MINEKLQFDEDLKINNVNLLGQNEIKKTITPHEVSI